MAQALVATLAFVLARQAAIVVRLGGGGGGGSLTKSALRQQLHSIAILSIQAR
jgi:hypothetical protein